MGILKSYNESRLTEARFGPGGNPKSSLPTAIKSRVDDLSRMTKIIASGNGLKFIANNAKLNQIKSENKITNAAATGKLFSKENLSALKSSIIDQAASTAKLIGSTLAQVPLNGTGTHLVHKFRTDTYLRPAESEERSGLAQFLGAGGVEGAPLALQGKEIYTKGVKTDKESFTDAPNNLNTKIGLFAAPLIKAGSKRVSSREIKIDINYNFSTDGKDEINLSGPYVENGTTVSNNQGYLDDLAPLRFSLITPENTTFIQFRAFITQFGDNFSSNWNSYKYLGRGENFYTYNSFDRGITLGFKVLAMSDREMKPLYSKLDTLASSTAPTYNDAGFMRGTLTRLTVGGYVKNLPGFIESVNYSITQDDQWDIGSYYTDGNSIPMSMDCTINFKPIHTFIPQAGVSRITRYIKNDFVPEEPLFGETNGIVETGDSSLVKQDVRRDNVPVPKPELENVFFSGQTVTAEKATGKVLKINGQDVERSQGGWIYKSDKRPALITRVNGNNAIFSD